MLFAKILRSIVRSGSLRIIDGAGRDHLIGDGSPPTVTLRLAMRRLGWTMGFDPALSIG